MTKVVLAEDDVSISEPLARALGREGYDVDVTASGEHAFQLAKGADGAPGADLVVLDLGLPDIDGLEVCRRLRAAGETIPVVVLTARADEVDAVVGLDAGADDYVTKPFRLGELLARVRAGIRRGAPGQPGAEGGQEDSGVEASVDGHKVRIDPDSRRAWVDETELALTAKEFDLLYALVRDGGRVVTRESLMREVWDTTWWTSTKTLDMHVSWLRRKLGDRASNPRFISTIRGLGFRFERD